MTVKKREWPDGRAGAALAFNGNGNSEGDGEEDVEGEDGDDEEAKPRTPISLATGSHSLLGPHV